MLKELDEKLFEAINKARFYENNDEIQSLIKSLIKEGADVNAFDSNGWTPIDWAIYNGINNNIVELLIEKGAELNKLNEQGFTPLLQAICYVRVDILQLLIDKGANVNLEEDTGLAPIVRAAQKGNSDIIKLLIERGADVNATDETGNNLVHYAVNYKSNEVLELLFIYGVNVDQKNNNGETPLFKLLGINFINSEGVFEKLELLLRLGADVNQNFIHYAEYEMSLLYKIASANEYLIPNKADLIKLLIEYGVTIDKKVRDLVQLDLESIGSLIKDTAALDQLFEGPLNGIYKINSDNISLLLKNLAVKFTKSTLADINNFIINLNQTYKNGFLSEESYQEISQLNMPLSYNKMIAKEMLMLNKASGESHNNIFQNIPKDLIFEILQIQLKDNKVFGIKPITIEDYCDTENFTKITGLTTDLELQ